uniref:DNA binding protein n=1 Tax=Lotharella vacuolata TaxID=74820 RepID=A0A0H5BQR6_9EUKA|nr:DNA binding protein [Lotharella vacuolata]
MYSILLTFLIKKKIEKKKLIKSIKKKCLNILKKIKIKIKCRMFNKNKISKIKFKKSNDLKTNHYFFDKDPLSCKEYKMLGICAYGNSCKFIHDRKIIGYCNIKY